MKERKRVKKFVYEGLGFPISLINVPMIRIRGVWTPDINYGLFQKQVLIALACRLFPLTGNELQFIRKYFEFTRESFALQFGVAQTAIVKWENRKEKIAKIPPSIEICIRLFILEKFDISDEKFKAVFRSFDLPKIAAIQKHKEKEGRSDLLQGVFKQSGRYEVRVAV